MKASDRSTIRDMHSLVQSGGYMLTVNPCSDTNASAVCQSVVDHASTVKHDGVLVVERTQRRGRTVIDRPHVHWVLNMPEQEAKAIEKRFADQGLDVKLTLVYDPRGLCWYLAKDPAAAYYIVREEDHTGSGTPPSAAIEQQQAGVPIVTENSKTEHAPSNMRTFTALGFLGWLLKQCVGTAPLPFLPSSTPLSRPVMVGMTRAP